MKNNWIFFLSLTQENIFFSKKFYAQIPLFFYYIFPWMIKKNLITKKIQRILHIRTCTTFFTTTLFLHTLLNKKYRIIFPSRNLSFHFFTIIFTSHICVDLPSMPKEESGQMESNDKITINYQFLRSKVIQN